MQENKYHAQSSKQLVHLTIKNLKSMIPSIIKNSDLIITTQSNNNRALESMHLKKIIKKYDNQKKVINKNKIKDAIKYCLSITKNNDLICITGSLYTVAEARDYFKKL